ncbi:maleylpyruvate isomerase family mycothiol-dependent enzyme [Actinoplanes sp. CA-030573]|uniref:maleylpyruvate isomerase family mycothiol-dependent enzyme n=1 Tax=Actinoplanes sp. CA-030573 TaxID=3239898 RepID=UPI003D91F456
MHPDDLEAYAFGDLLSPSVATHVSGCERCAAIVRRARNAAGWLAGTHAETPPPGLRSRVLGKALSQRPSSPYASQAAALADLLDSLLPSQWQARTAGGRTVRELIRHLAGNDGLVLADLGLDAAPSAAAPPGRGAAPPAAAPPGLAAAPSAAAPPGLGAAPPAAASPGLGVAPSWRAQSDRLLAVTGDLDRPVRLAGRAPMRRPLREALTQRAFETWIHHDDIRAAVALPPAPPPPAHLTRILEFGLALLPGAIDATGRGRPGCSVRLALTGPGGFERVVPLSARGPATGPPAASMPLSAHRPATGPPAASVTMPAERFARLMAGRVPVTPAVATVRGEPGAARLLLTVAATLGCE